jgi:hypothetical protein
MAKIHYIPVGGKSKKKSKPPVFSIRRIMYTSILLNIVFIIKEIFYG